MRKIEIVASDERLITPSGLSLVGQVLGKSDMIRKANRMRTEKRSQPQIGTGDILLTMIGLLTLGKSDFENVNEFHTNEEFYTLSLGLRSGIPSESSLRNRLDAIGTSISTGTQPQFSAVRLNPHSRNMLIFPSRICVFIEVPMASSLFLKEDSLGIPLLSPRDRV